MEILITHTYSRDLVYVISKTDKSDYVDVMGRIYPEMYDDDENPLSENVREMDECIQKWNPIKFITLFNNLMTDKNKDFIATIK